MTRRRAIRIVFDIALLFGFAAEFVTREGPDYGLHSWIGVVLVPVISVHLASNWRWVTSAARRRRSHPEWELARFNAVFSVVTAFCIASGFPLWLEWSDSTFWRTGHTVTGFLSILLAISHLWRNRNRVSGLLRRQRSVA
ncbi:MAG: hypothetical protein R8J94_15545 [Acidimicrobiia bacterium]|nr:hypothetical protein [Acidimicrobiia bacterium]